MTTTTTMTLISNQTFSRDATSPSTTIPAGTTAVDGVVTVTALTNSTGVEVDIQESPDGGTTWETRMAFGIGMGATGTFAGGTTTIHIDDPDPVPWRATLTFSGANKHPSITLSASLTLTAA